MKAKIATTIELKPEWLDEIRELIPGIELEVVHTNRIIQTYFNHQTKTNYGVFQDLRDIVQAPTGYRYRVYVMGDRKRQSLGMSDHLAAYDVFDRDGVLDFYMGVATRLEPRAAVNGFKSNFAWLFVHEILHGKEQETGRFYLGTPPDRTHDAQEKGTLKELLKEHQTNIGLMRKIVELLTVKVELLSQIVKKKPRLIHPVPAPFRRITQAYGVPNPIYPLTRHHIGTDYGLPVGSEILAPCDGEVTFTGWNTTMGYYLHYKLPGHVMRLAHLKEIPKRGKYQQGDIIALSGNTGRSTGPHLHCDVFINKVNLEGINASNFRTRTVDPEILYDSSK